MSKENNRLIAEFMGYKYYHPGVDIDESDCGGIYTRKEVFSKIPIEVSEYPEDDQYYFKDIPNPDYKKEGNVKWRNDYMFLGWNTINHLNYKTDLEYHSDWNLLVPVIEKIESITESKKWPDARSRVTHLYSVEIENRSCKISENIRASDTIEILIKGWSKIEATYNAVVEFLKIYKSEEL